MVNWNQGNYFAVCPDHPWTIVDINNPWCRVCSQIGAPNNGSVSNPKIWHKKHTSTWLRTSKGPQMEFDRMMEQRNQRNSQQSLENAAFSRLMQARGNEGPNDPAQNDPNVRYKRMIARNPAGYDNRFCQSQNCNAIVPRGSNYCSACQERGDSGNEMGLTPEGNYTTGRNY